MAKARVPKRPGGSQDSPKRKKPAPKPKRVPKKTPKGGAPRKGAPRGFKRVSESLPKNIEQLQATAAAQQRHSLTGAARMLDREGKVTTHVHVHRNRDGTVDGELRIGNIKRGYRITDLLTDVNIALGGDPTNPVDWALPGHHWISTGGLTDWGGSMSEWKAEYDRHRRAGKSEAEARELASKASSPLPRYRGQSRVAVYPQRVQDRSSRTSNVTANILRAQEGFLGETFRDSRGRLRGRKNKSKPTEILIRVYWNHGGKRPGRK